MCGIGAAASRAVFLLISICSCLLRHPLDCPLVMRSTYPLRCCFVVIEKPIGCLGIGPIFTSLVDRPVWLHDKLRSQVDAPLVQTGVLEFDCGKFIKAPLVFG
jgi:hypothetical protein